MKKILLLIVLLLLSCLFVSCDFFVTQSTELSTEVATTIQSNSTTVNTTTTSSQATTSEVVTTVASNEFAEFLAAFQRLSETTVYGHIYEKTQTLNGFVIYSNTVETKIVQSSPLLARRTVSEMTINDFNSDTQFTEVNYDLFYVATDTVLVEGETETSSDQVFSPISIDMDLSALLDVDNLSDWNIEGDTLRCTIDNDYALTTFGETVSSVYLEVDLSESNIVSVSLQYTIDGYTFNINNDFSYEAYNESIMLGYGVL